MYFVLTLGKQQTTHDHKQTMIGVREVVRLALLFNGLQCACSSEFCIDGVQCTQSGDGVYTREAQYDGDDPSSKELPHQDENWEEWRAWSDCSVTCGVGVRVRSRSCLTLDVGLECEGPMHMEEPCNPRPCPNNKAGRPQAGDDDSENPETQGNPDPDTGGQETVDNQGDDLGQDHDMNDDNRDGGKHENEDGYQGNDGDDCINDACNNQDFVEEDEIQQDEQNEQKLSSQDQEDNGCADDIDDEPGDDNCDDGDDDGNQGDEAGNDDTIGGDGKNGDNEEDFGDEENDEDQNEKPRHASTASDTGEKTERNDDEDNDNDDDNDEDGGESGNEEDDEGDGDDDDDDEEDDKSGAKRKRKKPRPEDEEEEEEEDKDEEEEEKKKKRRRRRKKKKKKKKRKKKKDETDTLVQEDSVIKVDTNITQEQICEKDLAAANNSAHPRSSIEPSTSTTASDGKSSSPAASCSVSSSKSLSEDYTSEDSSYSSSWSTGDESDTSESYSSSSGDDDSRAYSFSFSDSVFGSEPPSPASMPASPLTDAEVSIISHSSPVQEMTGARHFTQTSPVSPINMSSSCKSTPVASSQTVTSENPDIRPTVQGTSDRMSKTLFVEELKAVTPDEQETKQSNQAHYCGPDHFVADEHFRQPDVSREYLLAGSTCEHHLVTDISESVQPNGNTTLACEPNEPAKGSSTLSTSPEYSADVQPLSLHTEEVTGNNNKRARSPAQLIGEPSPCTDVLKNEEKNTACGTDTIS